MVFWAISPEGGDYAVRTVEVLWWHLWGEFFGFTGQIISEKRDPHPHRTVPETAD